jgi:DNA-binding NtrC family response regulator
LNESHRSLRAWLFDVDASWSDATASSLAQAGLTVKVFRSLDGIASHDHEPHPDIIVIGCKRADDLTLATVKSLALAQSVVVLISDYDASSMRLFFLAGATDVARRYQAGPRLAATVVGAEAAARKYRSRVRVWQPTA